MIARRPSGGASAFTAMRRSTIADPCWCSSPPLRPTLRTGMCRVARADPMAIVEPPLPGLDRVADAAPRPHEVVDVAPPGHQPPRRMFQRSPASSPQYAADGVPGARAHLTAARTKERFFASQVTAGGPIVAPRNTPTVPILQQPDPRKLRKCSEFLDSGEWAIQDSNLGPLPYQENLLSPPVPPTRT